MAIIQWVNLEKEDDYVSQDADITSKDRCGKLEIKTAFATGNVPLSYKVKVTPSGSDNVIYSAAELGRNNNFKMTKGAVDLGTETEVIMSDSVKLPAAGGNKYKLEAKDANGVVVKSEEIEAKRKLYYQFMHMEDSSGKVTPYSLSQLEGHCVKNHVVLTKAGIDKKIPFRKCINTGRGGRFNHVKFAQDINAKYDLKDPLKKVGCVTALSNYIAGFMGARASVLHTIGSIVTPNCIISSNNNVSGGSGKVSLTVLSGNKYLWYGLDDDDDQDKVWFIDGAINFTPNSSSSSPSALAGQSISINRADVSVGGTKLSTHGGYQVIDISIQSDLAAMLLQASGTIHFRMDINIVSGFSGGFSWAGGGFALTTCCTKAWFEDKNATDSDVIWNHEIGHRMGMVAHGNKDHSATNTAFHKQPKLPDAPPNIYGENRGVNDKGHQGPHCEKGALSYNATTNSWSGTPGCVLFGATGTAAANSPLDYCSDCTPAVRKLDLSFS